MGIMVSAQLLLLSLGFRSAGFTAFAWGFCEFELLLIFV